MTYYFTYPIESLIRASLSVTDLIILLHSQYIYILSIRRNIHTLPHQSCKVEHFSQLKRCNNIEETSARNVAALQVSQVELVIGGGGMRRLHPIRET